MNQNPEPKLNIESAGYNRHGNVEVKTDEKVLTIPKNSSTYTQYIVPWVVEGNTVKPYKGKVDFEKAVKDEVKKRILAVASEATQINLLSTSQRGLLDESDIASAATFWDWVSTIRRQGAKHINDYNQDYALDSEWTPLADDVVTFLQGF